MADTYVEEAKRKIADLSYKLEQAEEKIHKLEYDNAELQRWVNDTCLPRLQELSDEMVSRYNAKRYRDKNWNELRR